MKPVAIIYGTEPYLMEQGKAAFLASCRERSQEADVQVFHKDTAAAAVVEAFEGTSLFGGGGISIWYDCQAGRPLAKQAF